MLGAKGCSCENKDKEVPRHLVMIKTTGCDDALKIGNKNKIKDCAHVSGLSEG